MVFKKRTFNISTLDGFIVWILY